QYKTTNLNYLAYNVVNDLDNNIVIPKNVRGRGALLNTPNRFNKTTVEDFWDGSYYDAEFLTNTNETTYTDIYPKTIINKVDSPDVPSDWSMNPYQGCEHGCIYCYARITHEYWGYSAGTEFEKNILIKKDAPLLLAKKLQSKSWKGEPIMLSGNTDCYQPAELKFGITRQLLEVCLKHNQPVGIITKNALVCRDLDLLKQLAEKNLVQVHLSITTLDETLRRAMEPRTSSGANRLKTIELLQQNGIPVHVMMAPIIPGLNSDEVFTICEAVSKAGATSLNHTMVRLNGAIALLFEDWIQKTFPLKATRVLNLIAESQGGKLGNSHFGERMKGTGVLANSIHQQISLAKKKFDLNYKPKPLSKSLYQAVPSTQLNLF
ncbi:MAG: DNA repair photolyase, partial [Bacteroidia bacterium]